MFIHMEVLEIADFHALLSQLQQVASIAEERPSLTFDSLTVTLDTAHVVNREAV